MSEPRDAPLGILGGTFDPVHLAHLRLAEEARSKLHLDAVLWIPSGQPPHRAAPVATPAQRLAMVELAIRGRAGFVLDDNEIRSAAPSYTVTSLLRLREHHGSRPLVLLLGADAFLGLHSWHRWHEILALAHIAVATRPGYRLEPQQMHADLRDEYLARRASDPSSLNGAPAGSIVEFAIEPLDISASQIRALLASGANVADLLPSAVLDYIAANHLYSAS